MNHACQLPINSADTASRRVSFETTASLAPLTLPREILSCDRDSDLDFPRLTSFEIVHEAVYSTLQGEWDSSFGKTVVYPKVCGCFRTTQLAHRRFSRSTQASPRHDEGSTLRILDACVKSEPVGYSQVNDSFHILFELLQLRKRLLRDLRVLPVLQTY